MSKLSPQKAREMLKNPPHGKPLTTKQKHYFGMVAHGINKYEEGGWLDKYADGGEVNYNTPSVSLPKDYVGVGYDTTGRNYSPAWGGQFVNGGNIPGTVGFTYARTGSTPSNGKYAKKTMASAEDGTSINPYQQIAEYNPIPSEVPKSKEDYGVYGIIDSPMKAYHFEQSYWKAQENTPEGEQIQLIDTRNVPATQRFNPKVGKETVTNLVQGAKERGLNPATVLSMALAESNMSRVNPLHSGVRDMNSYDTMKYYAEKYPQGISSKTISDESLDLLKEKMDYARKLGKTSEEDIIQGWNGYGTIPADRPMYGIKGPIDMSKNPVYGKRIKELQKGVIEKTPALMDIVAGKQPLASLQDGGELTKLDQLENWTNYNKPTKGGWLNKYNGI